MFFIFVAFLYALLLFALAFGFARLGESDLRNPEVADPFVTVVVPCRNEARVLPTLLQDLAQVDYPSDRWEVILVDDGSTDRTEEIVSRLPRPASTRVLKLEHKSGKKAAITLAVEHARGEVIITTDADCHVAPSWLRAMGPYFGSKETKMWVGGVRLAGGSSLFARLQEMEFVSVIATGAATIGLGVPTMCNGANLAFRKSAFIECGGYEGTEHVTSGDDETLMNKIHERWPGAVAFLFQPTSVVSTQPVTSMRDFLQQRLRWAGKWKSNQSVSTKVLALVVWLLHLGWLTLPFACVAGYVTFQWTAGLLGVKMFADCLLLIPAANFLGVRWRWKYFFILQFTHSLYVVTVGVMSQVLQPTWKGRRVEAKV